ncbi:MAG: hypothetical protein V7607_1675 [Solirubrobacteraceae bacterium]
MEYRLLGRTGLKVSSLSFGAMTFGGRGEFFSNVGTTDVADARRQLDMCLEAGINLVDTADVYSQGLAEEILGRALEGRRDRLLLATKLHFRIGDGPNEVGQSRHHVIHGVDVALRRLRTDHLDLLQVHGFDAMTDLEQSLRALDDLVRSGKVRYLGCSNYSAWQLMKSLATSDRRGLERFSVLQAYYSLLGRDIEWELVPLCLDEGVGILVWSPLAGGYLTGKFRPGHAGHGRRARRPDPPISHDGVADAVLDALDDLAQRRGVSQAQVALNWVRARPGVTSVIVGARTADQLADNLQAASWDLEAGEREALGRASATPAPYPIWHQHLYNAERMRLDGALAPSATAAT